MAELEKIADITKAAKEPAKRPAAPQDNEGHKKALEANAKRNDELKALEAKISKHGFKTLDHHKEEALIHAKYRQ